MLLVMWESVREWTSKLPNELPFWELESQLTLESSKGHCKGQISIRLKNSLYHWKYLGTKMSEMGSHDPFEYLKYKLWLKEKSGIKLSIWLPTIKSWELPWFTCVQVVCHILLNRSRWKLQLCFKLHFNQRSAQKNMGFQSCRSPNFGNFGTPRTKWHLGGGPVARRIKY